MKSALVIGGGAFGTSMASILAQNFDKVYLKIRSKELYNDLLDHVNHKYLPELTLPHNIIPCLMWEEIDEDVSLVVSGLPTKAINDFYRINKLEILKFLEKGVSFVSLTKGIDPETLVLADDILFDIFHLHKEKFAFLSGPSFAKEIVEKQITMVSLASTSRDTLEDVVGKIQTDFFKVLPTYDIKGVLLGGALKNILAIAGGLAEGLGFNHNTRAALITRGIVEMLKFGKVYNARPETFYGLSGMGDLILTTTGDLSRNKSFGRELAKGRSAKEIIEESKHVVEGYKTTKAVHLLSEKYKISARLFAGMYEILFNDVAPEEMVKHLMSVPIEFE